MSRTVAEGVKSSESGVEIAFSGRMAKSYVRSESRGGRLIFIGDIHGCYDELVALLDRLKPADDDIVVACGDIVRKGPAVERCLDLWRDRGHLAVLGNNEMKLLRYGRLRRLFMLRADLLRSIAAWPLCIDFATEKVSAVHGGVLPDTRVDAQSIEEQRDVVYRLRFVRKDRGTWRMVPRNEEQSGDVLWSQVWRGNRTILYGHTPLKKPRFDEKAIGLDTGCVYGGTLTAAVLDRGKWSTVSVPAKRKYSR
jgi:serine/threonine protein phosphatase 1